jgi:hypothetical protein
MLFIAVLITGAYYKQIGKGNSMKNWLINIAPAHT